MAAAHIRRPRMSARSAPQPLPMTIVSFISLCSHCLRGRVWVSPYFAREHAAHGVRYILYRERHAESEVRPSSIVAGWALAGCAARHHGGSAQMPLESLRICSPVRCMRSCSTPGQEFPAVLAGIVANHSPGQSSRQRRRCASSSSSYLSMHSRASCNVAASAPGLVADRCVRRGGECRARLP